MRYRSVQPPYGTANTDANIMMRQDFGRTLLEVLEAGLQVINIDESSVERLDYRRKGWLLPGDSRHIEKGKKIKKLSLTAAISTTGEVYYSLHESNNNGRTFLSFLCFLVKTLDKDSPTWRQRIVFMLDNASYRHTRDIRDFLEAQQIQVLYTAPFSFEGSPIERLFGFIKRADLTQLDAGDKHE